MEIKPPKEETAPTGTYAPICSPARDYLCTTFVLGADCQGADFYAHRRALFASIRLYNDLPGRRARAGAHRRDPNKVTVCIPVVPTVPADPDDTRTGNQVLLDAQREITTSYNSLLAENV